MPTRPLGLYDLLAPQFLLGFNFPDYIDRYLSLIIVEDLRTSIGDGAVVYTGIARYDDSASQAPQREHQDANGGVFRWKDVTFPFRLTLPRDGATRIHTAISGIASNTTLPSTVTTQATKLQNLLDALGPAEDPAAAATDYPGFRFRLELMLSLVTLHLGENWLPGEIGDDRRVTRKTPAAGEPTDVRIILPKISFVYEQSDDPTTAPSFELESWGSSEFDPPNDRKAGEAVRMEPPIALHRSERFGFGIDHVIVDFSEDSTPPELLAIFGVDEGFRGIYVKSARIYYSDDNKGFAVNIGVDDLLISFAGQVSFDARADFIGAASRLQAEIAIYEGGRKVALERSRVVGLRVVNGQADVTNTAIVQVRVLGGIPPFTVSVKLGATEIWNAGQNQAPLSPNPASPVPPGRRNLTVTVEDSAPGTHARFEEVIELNIRADATPPVHGLPADLPASPAVPAASFALGARPSGLPASYDLVCTPAQGGTLEQVSVLGPPGATATVGGQPATLAGGRIVLDLPPGQTINLSVAYPALPSDAFETFDLFFDFDRPDPVTSQTVFDSQTVPGYAADTEQPNDLAFSSSSPPGAISGRGPSALRDWLQNRSLDGVDGQIFIDGYSSFQSASSAPRDMLLSQRRVKVAEVIAAQARPAVAPAKTAHGHFDLISAGQPNSDTPQHQVARIRARTARARPPATLTATLNRPPLPTTPPTPVPTTTPTPKAAPNAPPDIFRRLSLRVRLERNVPVIIELSGRLDFETSAEKQLRNGATSVGHSFNVADTNLGTTTPPSQPNAEDGVVDFTLNVTFDPAVHSLTETLTLGAAPADANGLLQMTNPHGATLTGENRWKDAFGSLLILAPVVNQAAAALNPNSAGDWAVLGGTLATPLALGALGVVRSEKITLYGGELKFRQFIPPSEGATFADAGVIFDYGVEFGLKIDPLKIETTKPLRVRYKAVGFKLNFQGATTYQPIFDTKKGYEIDLSDPGLFKLPAPLSEILQIAAVRIARVNPLTLEVDLGLKVDLGIVKVDRFKVKWPIDPLGVPSILPTHARIEIPGVLIGAGSVTIIDAPPTPPPGVTSGGGFEGTLDATLVSLKLRVAASLGVRNLTSGNRKAIAVFAGLIVEFPAPIPLGQSGLALYGLSGLFAMHYKRLEPAPVPNSAVGPALAWLADVAKGEPALLQSGATPAWGPELDRWSFGLGVILGTTEGGFIAQLRGTFILELPGPRILIMTKVTIISIPAKDLKPAADLKLGMLGVIDLDFQLGHVTIGILIDFEIQDVLKIQIPIELFFNLRDGSDWHLYIGTFAGKVTARILNLVNAYGYFMVAGKEIVGWPGYGTTRNLPGVAVATGLSASIILGDQSINLYLRVAVGADLGVSFAPFVIIGRGYLDGELRLFIISIEAHGELEIEHSNPTFLHARICGKVEFFFFDVEGCVEFSVGSHIGALPAPDLVTNVFLQSHAPVLTAGQAGDGPRPIDSSLGNAVPVSSSAPLPIVPIDSVIVVQLLAPPHIDTATLFTQNPGTPPAPAGYVVNVGGDRSVEYRITSIQLSPGVTGSATVPATWRIDHTVPPGGSKLDIDLALLSRVPITGEHALERSSDLQDIVTTRWENLCDPIAPPVCVLYTFCKKRCGESHGGWTLHGIPSPDPPGSKRGKPAPSTIKVRQSSPGAVDVLQNFLLGTTGLGSLINAAVLCPLPTDPSQGSPGGPTRLVCNDFEKLRRERENNPFEHGGVKFIVFDQSKKPLPEATFATIGGKLGLVLGNRAVLTLSKPADVVVLTMISAAYPANVIAVNSDGSIVQEKMTTINVAEKVTITGNGITHLQIDAPKNATALLEFCLQESSEKIRPNLDKLIADASKDPRRLRLLKNFARHDKGRQSAVQARNAGLLNRAIRDIEMVRDIPMGRLAGFDVRDIPNAPVVASPLLGGATGAGVAPPPKDPKDTAWRECMRLLRLPNVRAWDARKEANLDRDAAQRIIKLQEQQRAVTIETGQAREISLLLGLIKDFWNKGGVAIAEYDSQGTRVATSEVAVLTSVPVTGTTTGLPAPLTAAGSPWAQEVLPAAAFLALPRFAHLERRWVTFKPTPKTVRIDIITPANPRPEEPAGILAVLVVCPQAEVDRAKFDQQVQQSEIQTVGGYLQADPVPLLAPNTTYTLTVTYDATTTTPGSAPNTQTGRSQQFRFKTDATEPKRIDPWVYGTTPQDSERDVFHGDTVKLVFNDMSAVQLYGAYGKQLRAVLRRADGIVVLPQPVMSNSSLTPVPAEFSAPYREFLEAMVRAGVLPCVGSTSDPTHGSFTLPVQLVPLMAYTLDLELVPAPPTPTVPVPPLYRRQFTTGRYLNPAALAEDVLRRGVRHAALSARIAGLRNDGLVTGETDQALQDALIQAGAGPRAGAGDIGVVLYWAKRPAQSKFSPHAILIDSPESLWRSRYQPKLEPVPDKNNQIIDPAFQRLVPAEAVAMEILEQSGSSVDRYVHSPSGTRTLVLLRDTVPFDTTNVSIALALHRPASSLYGLAEENTPLLTLPLDRQAPWENDQ